MRNIVLNYCTGEWVVYIYADEFFKDYISVIKFFDSKRYMDYSVLSKYKFKNPS